MEKIHKTKREWKKELTPEKYEVLRKKGTEAPFIGKYVEMNEDGTYSCAACGQPVFSSETKYDSGCGWPSYYKPISKDVIVETKDKSQGIIRTEITCGRCGSHLGHVFPDGPQPTGLRYCVNSIALDFKKTDK